LTHKRKLLTVLACSGVLSTAMAGAAASPAAAACYKQGDTFYCFDRDGTQVRCYWDAADSKNVCVRIHPDGTREILT
jgi:hypothetical protein